jgi:hypothetical protein
MPRSRIVCGRAIKSVVEQLENRTLLTTLTGGGSDPVTGEAIANTYFYRDAADQIIRIDIGGDTTAEFIGARVVGGRSTINPLPLNAPTGAGYDLYNIYVADSNQFSFISITGINPTTGALLPFNGSAGSFRISNAITGLSQVITPNGGTGTVLLGARTTGNAPFDNIPINSRSSGVAIGVRPASARIPAGLQIAPGNDFGSFLFGGTIMGIVDIGGSINNFYAGNIWTGDATGIPFPSGGTGISGGKRVSNFTVGGNIHSLLVGGSIGTNTDTGLNTPDFNTGFDMRVGGIIGQVAVRDAFMGGIDAIHGRVTSEFGVNVAEVEGRNDFSARLGTPGEPAGWARGVLEGSNLVYNNTADQSQILPSFIGRRGRSSVVVTGQLVDDAFGADFVDYYAMPLLAGQDATVTLRPTGTVAGVSNLNFGVFDPDGRLVLTDYANHDTSAVAGTPVHFTADRPGLYRIAVAVTGNSAFANTGPTNLGVMQYTLTINGGGDLAVGGVLATNQITDGKAGGYGFFAENGDFGALQAGSNIFSLTDQTVNVRKGNLRSIEGSDLGILSNGLFGVGPSLAVPRGNVGLLRATTGVLSLNRTILPLPIGGDYQIIDAATSMYINAVANRGIGVIRAGNMATVPTPSTITVNADLVGADGIIDLIDVADDLGTISTGGPAITTGPGGNVRYMNVGGSVFRDQYFGSGGGDVNGTTYNPGEKVRLFDDSGTAMDFTPFPVVPNPAFVPGGTNPATTGPSLTITSYPIRGSGGAAIINVTSTGSVRIGAGGRAGSRAHAEIGQILTTGAGNPVVVDPVTNQMVFSFPTNPNLATNAANLEVNLTGSGTLDVYKIVGSDFTAIRNDTPGEILNIDATDTPSVPSTGSNNGTIGSLTATNIGVGVKHTGAAVNGIQTIGTAFPFNQQHNGVVSGNVLNVEAAGAIGNLNVTGNIGRIVANSGGKNTTGTFEGIAGPIVATGRMDDIRIGEGIMPTGSGDFSRAGLYAGGTIGRVRNGGRGSNIRGDIISQSNIARVELSNGSIIGSRIEVLQDFASAARTTGGGVLTDSFDTITNPTFEIGSISVSGYGGIIGSLIAAADIGDISVKGGFGIVNTFIKDIAEGTINSIYAEGYGLRGLRVDGGGLLNSMRANAKPRNISTAEYSPSVRLSESYDIDPFFDTAPNRETDLHIYLGTSARRPQIKRITDTGVIADSIATANRNAGTIYANQIRASQFNIANQIAKIQTTGVVDGLRLTTGRLKSYTSGNSSFGLDFSVAGPIDDFRVVGDLDDTSIVRALGPAGRITNFIVDGTMNGDASSSNSFHLLAVGKDLGAPSLVTAKSLDERRIRGGLFGTVSIG